MDFAEEIRKEAQKEKYSEAAKEVLLAVAAEIENGGSLEECEEFIRGILEEKKAEAERQADFIQKFLAVDDTTKDVISYFLELSEDKREEGVALIDEFNESEAKDIEKLKERMTELYMR
jgi:hypothetical protein